MEWYAEHLERMEELYEKRLEAAYDQIEVWRAYAQSYAGEHLLMMQVLRAIERGEQERAKLEQRSQTGAGFLASKVLDELRCFVVPTKRAA